MTSTIDIILGTPRSGTTAMTSITRSFAYRMAMHEPANHYMFCKGKLRGEKWCEASNPTHPVNMERENEPAASRVRSKLLEVYNKYVTDKYDDDFDFTNYLINLCIQNNFSLAKLMPWWGEANLFVTKSVTKTTLDSVPYQHGGEGLASDTTNQWGASYVRGKIIAPGLHGKFGDVINRDEFWAANGLAQIKELIEHKKVRKILLLYRKDLFRQALSNCISLKLWKWHDPDRDFIRKSTIGELNEKHFKSMLWKLDCYNKFVKSLPNNGKYKLCKYEDFYEKRGRETYWEDMLMFLIPPEERTKDRVGRHIKRATNNYAGAKYNGPETYAKIKNLDNLKNIYSDFMSLFS